MGYDEETDLEYEHPEAKSIDTSIFKEFENNPGKFYNNEWDDDWMRPRVLLLLGNNFSVI